MTEKISGLKFKIILIRGFSLIILLTLIMGFSNMVALQNSSDTYEKLINNTIELELLAKEIDIQLLQATKDGESFIVRKDGSKLVSHENRVKEILVLTSKILELDIPDLEKLYASDISSLASIYGEQSKLLFDDYIERRGGRYADDSGLIGNLELSINDLENYMSTDFENGDFNNTMLYLLNSYYNAIRKNEKDYLLRLDSEYYNQSMVDLKSLNTTLNLIITNKTRLNEYNNVLLIYITSFDSIVKLDIKIRANTLLYDEKSKRVEFMVEKLLARIEILKENAEAELEQVIKDIRRFTLLIIVGIFGFSTIVITYLTTSVTKPVSALNKEVKIIAQGDLTQEVVVTKTNTLELNELRNDVNAMRESLSNTIRSIAKSTVLLKSTSEDILSGAEEINASSEEVASTSQAMSDGATSQTELIADVNDNINEIQLIVNDIVKKIQLNTQEVSQIALQTNILALNAGIEASRAGDYGRGFAVVAENVRKLSDQSKLASERIDVVAKEIRTTLQSSFDKITGTIINVVSVSEETAASAEEVAAAAEEMTATIEELSSVARELTFQAEQSEKLVSNFKYE